MLTNTGTDGADSLIHEMGHFFDDILLNDVGFHVNSLTYHGETIEYAEGGIRNRSELDDFKEIWLQECSANYLISEYERTDQCEYFAGSFSAYIREPLSLKSIAPRTYEFINTCIHEL